MNYNRWFPCDQDINSDPKINDLCIKFGVAGLRIWLEMQSISDRNEGTVPGDYQELMRPLSGRCQTTNRRVIEVLEWLNSRLMIEGQSPVRVLNYWDFHRNRMPNSRKKDGELDTPPPNTTPSPPKPPIVPQQGTTYTAGFELFWAAYPKKIGKDKAWESWRKKKCEAKTDAIVGKVGEQKTWQAWTKENGEYIPNPTTYLNQGRWKDESSEWKPEPLQLIPADPNNRMNAIMRNGHGRSYLEEERDLDPNDPLFED